MSFSLDSKSTPIAPGAEVAPASSPVYSPLAEWVRSQTELRYQESRERVLRGLLDETGPVVADKSSGVGK